MLKSIHFSELLLFQNRKAEREFYRTQFDLYKTDLRKSWKIIKTIIGKSDRISNISDEFLINDKIVSDKTFITNAFNNYFLNVGKTGDPLSYVNSNLTTGSFHVKSCDHSCRHRGPPKTQKSLALE